MQEKLLTVSIAAYNVEKTLREAVQSLLLPDDQMELLEIIVVNDGSTDGTGALAHELGNSYPQSIVVIDKPNGGYGSTINASLKIARGRYYRLLDGDDCFDTENLKRFLSFLSGCDSDLVVMPYDEVREDRKRIDLHPGIPDESIPISDAKLTVQSFAMHELTVKTDVLRRGGEPIAEKCFYTDSEFTFYCLAAAETISRFKDSVYQYRLGAEGQSVSLSGVRKHYRDKLTVARRVSRFYSERQKDIEASKKELLSFNLQCIFYESYRAFLLLEHPSEKMNELRAFDQEIKDQYPDAYTIGGRSRLVSVMRRLRFRGLALLSIPVTRKYTQESGST